MRPADYVAEQLIHGCSKHPAYRYKRKPKECARCNELYDLYLEWKATSESSNQWKQLADLPVRANAHR